MSIRSKRKGKYLENKVASIIQEEWHLNDHEVHRNQTSGVFHTEYGDIYFKDLPVVIECKNQESWDLKHVLFWNKPIIDWWNQLIRDVEKYKEFYKQEPLYCLVVSKSRYPEIAIFSIKNLQNNCFIQIENPIADISTTKIIVNNEFIAFELRSILKELYRLKLED